jgi:hypothetical protein
LPRSRSINAWARKMAKIELNEITVGTSAEATDWDLLSPIACCAWISRRIKIGQPTR